MHQPSPNDRVRLTRSIPTLWLQRGDVGSIRSVWSSSPGFYEVEFHKAGESCAVRAAGRGGPTGGHRSRAQRRRRFDRSKLMRHHIRTTWRAHCRVARSQRGAGRGGSTVGPAAGPERRAARWRCRSTQIGPGALGERQPAHRRSIAWVGQGRRRESTGGERHMNRNIKQNLLELDRHTDRNIEQSLLDLDFAALTRGPFTPSPAAWEDQVLYFLMLDRFSDGNENGGYADVSGRPVDDRQHAALPPAETTAASITTRGSAPAAAGRAARSRGSPASSATSVVWASPRSGSARRSDKSRSSRAITATASRTSSTWTRTSARARSSATSSARPTSRGSTSSST